MLDQTAKSKMEKFTDAMPTIIQTHLITCDNWAKTTKKAKELEHIMRKCDPLAAALPTLTQGTAVPSLYSHIAYSSDKEETDIHQPFKEARSKQTKTRGRGKGKQPQQKPNPLYKRNNTLMKILTITTTMKITEVNPEDMDLIEANILDDFSGAKIPVVESNVFKTHTKVNIKVTIIKVITTKATMVNTTTHIEAINRVTITASLEVEAMVMVEVITTDTVMAGLIIEAITIINTISIMIMMMTTSLINMAHHVHYVMAIIIPPNIVLRENMILKI